jgi:hypothetical protein
MTIAQIANSHIMSVVLPKKSSSFYHIYKLTLRHVYKCIDNGHLETGDLGGYVCMVYVPVVRFTTTYTYGIGAYHQ